MMSICANANSPICEIRFSIVLHGFDCLFNYKDRLRAQWRDVREIVEAAKNGRAHDFICRLPKGYASTVGERGACFPAASARELRWPERF